MFTVQIIYFRLTNVQHRMAMKTCFCINRLLLFKATTKYTWFVCLIKTRKQARRNTLSFGGAKGPHFCFLQRRGTWRQRGGGGSLSRLRIYLKCHNTYMCHGGRGTMRCQYKCLVIEEAIFTWRQYNIGPTKLKLLISVSAPSGGQRRKYRNF